ncbi:MAG: FKBP-type peptidyl-prolyl cis-trans isomerase [Solirubrobacterales bacterium]
MALGTLFLSACGSSGDHAASVQRVSAKSSAADAPSGPPSKNLVIKDLVKGKGVALPPIAQTPRVKITALYTAVEVESGELYEERQDPHNPYEVEYGPGLNEGWEKGLAGMRVGGRRKVIMPLRMTYGTSAKGPLVYVIHLIRVQKKKTSSDPRAKKLSKAETAKLPKLVIPKSSGPPPRHLEVIDLRRGPPGPTARKTDVVSIRFLEDTYPEARNGKQGGLSGGVVSPHYWLGEAPRGLQAGIPGMKVGGRRELIVPPKMAYPRWKPSWGYAPYVSVYVVDLLGMEPPADRRLEHRG